MTIERWGAFSVIDHQDARMIAAEVLLYDRLVLPQPPEWDRPRWLDKKWDPDGMDRRIKQLEGLAIPAAWDLDRQKEWKAKFNALSDDAQDINAALRMSRRVLIDHARSYRPPGVSAIEVLSAYQSEADFTELEPAATAPERAAQLNFLIANRILIPDEADPEESLKRALGIAQDGRFLSRRRRFYDWQRSILAQGVPPRDAAAELSKLVREYNQAVTSSKRSYRIETAMLVGGLSAIALGVLAPLAPEVFAAVGIGALKGAQVMSIGSAATGGILQIARHVRGRRDPDAATRTELSGAMFHQIEQDAGWGLRPG